MEPSPDPLLLAEALVVASYAYGDDQWARADLVKAFLRTLPELRGVDVGVVYRDAERSVRRHGALARIHALRGLGPSAVRRRYLLLAMDVAYSSGVLDDGEILDAMKVALDVPEAEVRRYADVLRVKYAAQNL